MSEIVGPKAAKRAPGSITACFVGFLVVYVVATTALRGQFDLRYNDTTGVANQLQNNWGDDGAVAGLSKEMSSLEFWEKVCVFGDGDHSGVDTGYRPDAYRPLQYVYSTTAALLYLCFGPLPDYLLCFLLLGLSGYLVYLLFEEVGSGHLSWICSAAYLFFPAVVSPAWNPLAGPQSIIPSAFAGALLAYLRYTRTGLKRYLFAVAVICAVGPMYKETIGVLPFLLLAHHLFVAPAKHWGMAAGLALACLHGIFPSTAVTFAITGEIRAVGIFGRGALHDHAAAGTWRPNFLMDLAAFVPPSLLLVSLISITGCAYITKPVMRLTLPTQLTGRAIPLIRGMLFLVAAAASLALVALIVGRPILGPPRAALLAFTAIGLYGLLYLDILIAGWFFCMFLPLLRVYFNTTQCGYVAAPLIYVSVAPLFQLYDVLAARKIPARLQTTLKYALVAVGALTFCDNALSLPNSWIAYRETGRFNDNLLPVDLCQILRQQHADKDWTFIENTVVVDDAAILATQFGFGRGRYNFDYGVPPSKVIKTEQELQTVLSSFNCVLVVADRVNPHRREFWDLRSIQKHFRSLTEQKVGFEAYYADPLRRLIDNRYRSMMAPPDFQDEFAKETRLFRERFTNHFHVLVRARGQANLAGLDFGSPVTIALREEGFKGFNIIQAGNRFFGLAPDEGIFDLNKVARGEYRRCIEGASILAVKERIDESVTSLPNAN